MSAAVTIVVPTHDRLAFLPEAVESVRQQTFPDWRLVVVDDGSSDGTAGWLAALDDPRIRAIRIERNVGNVAARNRALEEPPAPLVMFLDDDDRLRPHALGTLVAALGAHPEAIAAAGAKWRFRDWGHGVRIHHVRRPRVRDVSRELLFGWTAVSGQVLYRTEAVRAVGGFPAEHPSVADRDLWLRLARRGPVALVPDVVLDYRVHPGQSNDHRPRPGEPGDIGAAREALWQDFLATLPPRERRAGLRVRRAARTADRAEAALREGRSARALRLYATAAALAPGLAASPLVGPPLRWGARRALAGPGRRRVP